MTCRLPSVRTVVDMWARRPVAWAMAVGIACAGCTPSPGNATPASSPTHVQSGPQPVATSASHLSPPVVPAMPWRPEGTVVDGQPATYVATTRGGTIGLLWMDPRSLVFRFVPGTQVPEGGPVLPADRVAATWVGRMAAAFNGAFRLRDNVGGYFYHGTVVKPLRDGLASMVIDQQGHLSIIRWGRERHSVVGVQVVRQNLPLLVDQYTVRASAHDGTRTWGAANNNTRLANRSALGQLADGSLVYAYGRDVTALDLAAALVAVHARTAIMLDMNKSQPGGFVYWHEGSVVTGRRILPSIDHQPSVYLAPHYKDLVVALTRP